MSIPIPNSPVVAPNYSKQVGNSLVDVVNKSQKDIPIVDTIQNACDVDSQKEFRMSANVNELTSACEIVQSAQISVKGRLPVNATAADFDLLLGIVETDLKAALGFTQA